MLVLLRASADSVPITNRPHARPHSLVMAAATEEPVLRPQLMGAAALTGTATGAAVAGFKTAAVGVAAALYAGPLALPELPGSELGPFVLVPALGGLASCALCAAVSPSPQGELRAVSPSQGELRTVADVSYGSGIGPDLAGHAAALERAQAPTPVRSLARSAATVLNLGSGNSLGGTGPAVEIGVAVARSVAQKPTAWAPAEARARPGDDSAGGDSAGGDTGAGALRWRRQLFAVGSAAGVAAVFAAPLAGVFFALEVVPTAVRRGVAPGSALDARRDAAVYDTRSRAALPAVALSALIAAAVARALLGVPEAPWALAFLPGALGGTGGTGGTGGMGGTGGVGGVGGLGGLAQSLPLFALLGACSGGVATAFTRGTAASKALFATRLRGVPAGLRPAVGGLGCGLIGAAYPQVRGH